MNDEKEEKEDTYDKCVLVSGNWSFSFGSYKTEIYNTHTKKIENGPDMLYPRYGHTMTTLLSGKILVCGGYSYSFKYSRNCELFDPKTLKFEKTGPMKTGRRGHTATLLKNGKVLVFGGTTNENHAVSTAELYDPITAEFTAIPCSETRARTEHAAAILPNGDVLLWGGEDNELKACRNSSFFNTEKNVFYSSSSVVNNTTRMHHAIVVDSEENVVAFGGSEYGAPVYLFNPFKMCYTQSVIGLNSAIPTEDMCAVHLDNDTVFVCGGTGKHIKATCLVELKTARITIGPSFTNDRRDSAAAIFNNLRK